MEKLDTLEKVKQMINRINACNSGKIDLDDELKIELVSSLIYTLLNDYKISNNQGVCYEFIKNNIDGILKEGNIYQVILDNQRIAITDESRKLIYILLDGAITSSINSKNGKRIHFSAYQESVSESISEGDIDLKAASYYNESGCCYKKCMTQRTKSLIEGVDILPYSGIELSRNEEDEWFEAANCFYQPNGYLIAKSDNYFFCHYDKVINHKISMPDLEWHSSADRKYARQFEQMVSLGKISVLDSLSNYLDNSTYKKNDEYISQGQKI